MIQNVLQFKSLKNLETIDELIYENEEFFYWSKEKAEEIQFKLIKEAFEYHFENCADYREYSKKLNVTPKDIKEPIDLINIPLIPSTMFKLKTILSCDEKEIVKVCQSSGTSGSISKVYRDEKTLNRFLGSMQSSVDQIFEIDDAYCINLGPSTEEAGDLWFSYAISVVDMIFPTENFVVNDVFYPNEVVEKIQSVIDKYENIIIIGAPIMFLELINYMESHNISIDKGEKFFFITAGGWKRYSGQMIPRKEFWNRITARFHNSKKHQFRDSLNMVELNTVLSECEFRIKHVVPWVKVLILNPITMKPVEDGEIGLIAYLDPSARSYPAFILTDDLGRILIDGQCKCKRIGQGLEIIRRVQSIDSRGCALKIDKKYTKEKS